MSSYLLHFREIDKTKHAIVGGKGANLGELSKIKGIEVPEGFCITTDAYKNTVGQIPEFDSLLRQLSLVQAKDARKVTDISRKIRAAIEGAPMEKNIEDAIAQHLAKIGDMNAYAVRSSATAEDLSTASFAGQQETYLNIIGMQAILQHVSKCWASLFTERAVIYRIQNGIDHRTVSLAVILQKMVFPQASGILFTADPVSGNRTVTSIDAGFGLGEALVSGLVNADAYKVKNCKITEKKISAKMLKISVRDGGGTKQEEIALDRQNAQVLTDEQILQLEHLGRTIEAHFGSPQDIEWCLADDHFFIVQSRPITTLFPIPDASDDTYHVYISVGHQQMMTDAMKPLGISVWQLTAARPMDTAGGRLFVDVSQQLASPVGRHMLVDVLGKSDPLIRGALLTVIERGDIPLEKEEPKPAAGTNAPPPPNFQALNDYDPAIVTELIRKSQESIEEARSSIERKSGVDLIDAILEDIPRMKKSVFDPQSSGVFLTAMNASTWINEKMIEWLGEKNVADRISQSVPHNVTSEMGLALLDVADVIRPYPHVIEYLEHVKGDDFLDELVKFDGGQEVRDALEAYLKKYGMRCAGEIDITKARWSEKPTTLLPLILSNVKNFELGAGKRKFEKGRQEAFAKEEEILSRLKSLPDGEQKARETKRMIDLVRNFIGYREYPKYSIVSRYFVYKQALLEEAERLVQEGVLRDREDVYYLTFQELREMVRTRTVDYAIIDKRKDDFRFHEKLMPPRVMTSDGEMLSGTYNREHVPVDALAGLAVSAGVIEGRARVILSMEDANVDEGDILVTPFTDPSWTPLFVSIKGLVTEVGGLMTHGAVIAREYGLPAVVGVENATKLIKDGQQVRINGTEGYVEIL